MALRSPSSGSPAPSLHQDPELVEWARELDIDPSGLADSELLARISEVQKRWWELHGAELMQAYNEMIARDGRPLDGWTDD